MRNEYFCNCCMRNRHVRYFQNWLNDKSKARRCDDCINDNDKSITVIKVENTNGLSKTKFGVNSRKVRDDIYDLKEQMRINSEFDL